MVKEKERIQCLVFEKKHFHNRWSVKAWIKDNDYKIDNRLKYPIYESEDGKCFRVIQRNCAYYNKKTFKERKLCKGIKGVYGVLKNKR